MSKSFRLSSGAWLLMSLVAACQGAEQGRSSGTEVEGTEPERSEPENPAHEDGTARCASKREPVPTDTCSG
jgi:hypothetical protein